MIILGIHDGHEASAALLIDGKVICAVQEERFTKLKGDYGFPINAVKYCLKSQNLKTSDIDEVALGTFKFNPVLIKIKRNANFEVSDWIEEQERFWKPVLLYKKKTNYWNIFKNKKFKMDKIYNFQKYLKNYMSEENNKNFLNERVNKIARILKIKQNKIKVYLHEECHKNYAYFFFPDRIDGISITSESVGDYSSGSVSTIIKNYFTLKSHTKENHLGHIYMYITLLLGMRPCMHEYKVMGLAPYASDYEINKCFHVFNRILKIKKLNIVYDKKPNDLYFSFKRDLKNYRFDGIAGAVQKFLEMKLENWFLSCKKILKLKNFYFSGGVAQNIKAAMVLLENKKIGKVFVPPAAGDSTISIGACFHAAADFCERNKINKNKYIKSIDNMYLGYRITNQEIMRFFKKNNILKKYNVRSKVTSKEIANELAKGKVVARCSGNMEFGLRSLGNRSILCDPRYHENINLINRKIKKRDFWMPFTPTILDTDEKKFIINPKNFKSKFMSMAFRTTKFAKKKLQAAIHPADFTARPQILSKKDNLEYYNILREFKKITGVGALLNTSFNLHGLPIVMNVKDAFNVFENSDLDILILENYIIRKN